MKLLTKHTDYAIRALMQIASHEDGYLSAKAIAEKEEIPYAFLRGLLQTLGKEGIVETRPGPTGGMSLAVEPDEIHISRLIKIFQGGVEFTECLFRKNLCHNRNNCVLRHELLRIEQIVSREFDGMTIQTLLDRLKVQIHETQNH